MDSVPLFMGLILTKMNVMSSREENMLSHSSMLFSRRMFAASSILLSYRWGASIFTTSWFYRCSQTPSEATKRYLCRSCR